MSQDGVELGRCEYSYIFGGELDRLSRVSPDRDQLEDINVLAATGINWQIRSLKREGINWGRSPGHCR